jgi:phosphatidylserine decarboxylase
MSRDILVYDPLRNAVINERVYGEEAIRFLYESRFGGLLAHRFLSRHLVSKLMGIYYSSPSSARLIQPFVEKFGIDMGEYEARRFRSFNEFFTRRFRADARLVTQVPDEMAAFAEGRYFGWNAILPHMTFPVKGSQMSIARILDGEEKAASFQGGPVLLARLCPVDYHRFHFPDSGRIVSHSRVPGRLHSVNPSALGARPDVFMTNERQVSILETTHFGKLAYVEVGALGVGKICQTHALDTPFARGSEKGYFEFGASTIILFGERGRWQPDSGILECTLNQMETLVRLGQCVARKAR